MVMMNVFTAQREVVALGQDLLSSLGGAWPLLPLSTSAAQIHL